MCAREEVVVCTIMSDIKVKTEEIPSSNVASHSQEEQTEATSTETAVKTEETPSSNVDLQLEPPKRTKGVPTVIRETCYYYSDKPNLIEYNIPSSTQTSSNAANSRPAKRAKIEKNKEEYFLEIRWLKDFEDMDEPRGEKNYYVSHL